MLQIGHRSLSITVLIAVAIHATWAMLILHDESALNANAVHALFRFVQSPQLLALVLMLVAASALAGSFIGNMWLLMPQQVVLVLSGVGAIESIWLAQFADGVLRPHAFIMADQVYSIYLAIGHTVAISQTNNGKN